MSIWRPRQIAQPQVRLYKVEENRKYWVFFFRDPVNLFIQTVIMPKNATWEGMADAWERMHKTFHEAILSKL